MIAEPLRVLLVDDHRLFRKGLVKLLESLEDIEVVGEAGDGEEAIAQARETMPDVVLMDLAMPRCNGLIATLLIKQEMPHVKIIILTVSEGDRDLFDAIKNGADGYLLKNMDPCDLFDLLEGLKRGETAMTRQLAERILQDLRQPALGGKGQVQEAEALSAREIEVLEYVVQGASNREIAKALSISGNTVKIHLANILTKLHLSNRIQAAVYAVREGLVEQPSRGT